MELPPPKANIGLCCKCKCKGFGYNWPEMLYGGNFSLDEDQNILVGESTFRVSHICLSCIDPPHPDFPESSPILQ